MSAAIGLGLHVVLGSRSFSSCANTGLVLAAAVVGIGNSGMFLIRKRLLFYKIAAMRRCSVWGLVLYVVDQIAAPVSRHSRSA